MKKTNKIKLKEKFSLERKTIKKIKFDKKKSGGGRGEINRMKFARYEEENKDENLKNIWRVKQGAGVRTESVRNSNRINEARTRPNRSTGKKKRKKRKRSLGNRR